MGTALRKNKKRCPKLKFILCIISCLSLYLLNVHVIFFLEANDWSQKFKQNINAALEQYIPCKTANCSCHKSVIDLDLLPFQDGITKEVFDTAVSKGTKYQVKFVHMKSSVREEVIIFYCFYQLIIA